MISNIYIVYEVSWKGLGYAGGTLIDDAGGK
jgi:hypothetical protein